MYLDNLLTKTWKIIGPALFIISALLCPVKAQDSTENKKIYVLPTPDQLNVQVVPGGELVKLDGILDEAVWQTAEPVTEFWQREPVEGVPPTEKTEVRVLQDEHALYFGIMCYDSDPDGIIALDMRRDATLGNDDYLGLYLDTYHDHRNFYYFSTNALGCRRDGIVTDARFYNTAWNGIWQAKAKITEEGWSAEWRIPFSTLHFGGEQPMTWGLNFSRAIRRKQESIRWATVPRELGHAGTWRGEFFGQLNGIKTKSSNKKWEAEPYMLAGGEKKYRPDSTDSKFNAGGELSYDFTPNLRGSLSLRTDFAQVEADQEVINYTRFPLFFPEKREFFLQNSGLFNVGYDGEMMMFYSRRIGLAQGQEVPLLAAGNVSGRIGPYSVGVMNVQSEKTDLNNDDGSSYEMPSTNYSVFRVKRDLFTNSSIGTIFTNNQSGSNNYSRLLGLDGNFWLTSFLKGEGLLSKTFNPAGKEDGFLGTGRLLFSKYNIDADLRYDAIGPDFNPEMGFVLQNDLRRSSAKLSYTQWINHELVRSINYVGTFTSDTLYNHDYLGQGQSIGAAVTFESADKFGYSLSTASERIYDPFTVGPITIKPGDYDNRNHWFLFQSNASRKVSLEVDYQDMDYWGGDRKQLLISNNIHPIANLSVDFIYTYNTVDHPAGRFDTTTLSNRIFYAFNTELFVKSYVQWNDLDKRFSFNFLGSYEYRPGSDIALVYNEIRDRFQSPHLAPRDRILMLKWTYNLRF